MANLAETQIHQEIEYSFPYHYLDLKVDSYRLIWSLQYRSYLNIVKKLLRPFTNQRILDVGCGDGRFCYELSKENVRITGLDYSEQAINFAKAFNPNTEFLIQDLKNLKLPDKYDSLVLIETLEHIKPEEISIILESLSTVLKENGKLIVTVPSSNIPVSEKHYQHFTEGSLRKTLEVHFAVNKIIGYGKLGFKRKVFNNMKRLGIFLLPFRKKLPLVESYYLLLKKYYEQNLNVGKPKACEGLIAVCEKKSNSF